MKNTLIIIFLIASNFLAFSQDKKVNNYKYIIVSEKFDFLKQKDQYQTSSLTKFLLKKNGFIVILDSEEYPLELKNTPCKGLKANVINNSSMFSTKVSIELRDCYNKVVYTSKEGKSKLKEYEKSYQEAIRRAYESMSTLKYKAPNIVTKPSVIAVVEVTKPTKSVLPLVKKSLEVPVKKDSKVISVLYAQPNENGFQLVDANPKVVFLIMNTNIKDVFIIKNKNGLLYKKDANWIAEFYENDKLVVLKYQIKF